MTGIQTPLVPNTNCPALYDVTALMEMETPMAQGFAILLTGAAGEQPKGNSSSSSNNKKNGGISQQAVMLGFSALTDGNVLDACFGVLNKQTASKQGLRQAKDVKIALSDAAESNNKIPRIAVAAHSKAFRTILAFRAEVDKLNFFTKCFKYAGIQKKAKEALEEAFGTLQDAIQATR